MSARIVERESVPLRREMSWVFDSPGKPLFGPWPFLAIPRIKRLADAEGEWLQRHEARAALAEALGRAA